jgi:hypothetical protein
MFASIGKWLATLLVNKLVESFITLAKEWYDEKKLDAEVQRIIKQKVEELKNAKTPDEIRAALRELNL